jgi:hypothetical protein
MTYKQFGLGLAEPDVVAIVAALCVDAIESN